MKRPALIFISLLLIFGMAGCTPAGLGGSKSRPAVESGELQFQPPQEGDFIATIHTSKGNITVLLYANHAPQAVENFRLLAERGYYDGTDFHRVIKDFIIQAGDPTGTGLGGESAWGTPFPAEISDQLHHYSGALCTAAPSGRPDLNQSQFYIVATPADICTEEMLAQLQNAGYRPEVVEAYRQAGGAPYLDNGDTVFGQVIAGMDVVDAIAAVSTSGTRPRAALTISGVEIAAFTES